MTPDIAIIIIAVFAAAVIYSLIKHSGHGVIAILTIIILIMPALSRAYWFFDYQTAFDIVLTVWLLILIWLLMKCAGPHVNLSSMSKHNYAYRESDYADDQIKQMYNDRSLSKRISGQLRKLRRSSDLLGDKNGQSTDLLLQLQRILPEQGFLVNRMAGLRKNIHWVRNGHIAKIKEIKKLCQKMPALQKQKISRLLIEHYQKQTDLDKRLERLEGLVADAEKKNRDLAKDAQICIRTNNFKKYDHIPFPTN